MKKKILDISNIHKSFGKSNILNGITFSLSHGEILSLLGSSGSGKTTLLRILIGLEKQDTGTICLNSKYIENSPPNLRDMGIVFQNYALFPHKKVIDNISYGLKNIGLSNSEAKDKSYEMLKKVHLISEENKYPHQLSGGQKQRVAIARTLVMEPSILLLDEPLSSLDMQLRETLKEQIKEIQQEFSLSIIYVTHDQEEAFSLSDNIMILKDGNVEQIASPKEIYHSPKTEYVKEFVVNQINRKISSIIKNANIKI